MDKIPSEVDAPCPCGSGIRNPLFLPLHSSPGPLKKRSRNPSHINPNSHASPHPSHTSASNRSNLWTMLSKFSSRRISAQRHPAPTKSLYRLLLPSPKLHHENHTREERRLQKIQTRMESKHFLAIITTIWQPICFLHPHEIHDRTQSRRSSKSLLLFYRNCNYL